MTTWPQKIIDGAGEIEVVPKRDLDMAREERDTAIALLQEALHEGVLPPSFKERAWRFLANPMRRVAFDEGDQCTP
jgi:hypothetical protein